MAKKTETQHQHYPKCPLYTKDLETCPSSKSRLQAEDLALLLGSCVSDKYKSCKFFQNKSGKEQAA